MIFDWNSLGSPRNWMKLGVLPCLTLATDMGWFSHVQSEGIPAVEFRARCDLIFDKYDKDVSLGRWVRVGCGRMNLSGLCCLHSLLMSGSIPMGCRKKTSSSSNCVEKTKDRSISWYILGMCFLSCPYQQTKSLL